VDARKAGAFWSIQAHEKEATGLCLSSYCADLMVTASVDETVKVWDIKDKEPKLVTVKNLNIGPIYTLTACPDVPYVFCAGGSKKDNHMYLWDTRENEQGK